MMDILVPVTEVAELQDDFEIAGRNTISAEDSEFSLNDFDEYAVEAAVQLKEGMPECEVTAVTIGSERTEEVLRRVLAKGADRALRLWDDTLPTDRLISPRLKGQLLARFAAEEEPNLVLTGVQGADHAFATTGVLMAHELGYEWATLVVDLEYDDDSQSIRAQRELEGGTLQPVKLQLPAVLTIQTGINEPRYASLRELRAASRHDIPVLDLDDIGLTVPELERDFTLVELEQTPQRTETEYFEGPTDEAAVELATLLQHEGAVS